MTIETTKLTQPSEHERELTITVPETLVRVEFDHTLEYFKNSASRPGFRPGKMPRNMVYNFYQKQIKQKLTEKLFEKSFADACKDHKLIPVTQPKLEALGEIDQSKPFTYKAIFQVKPTIENPEFQGLALEIKQFTFDDSDTEDEVKHIQESMATFRQPEDSNFIKDGDLVLCDTTVTVDDAINEALNQKDYSVPLFSENVPAPLKSLFIGKKIGDKFTWSMPEEDKTETLSGKECLVIFTIKSIKERILPDIDDNLAKDVSDKFSTLDQLKESIKLRLTVTARRRYEYFKQETITKALIEKNPFLVPPALIERMALSMINRELEAMSEKSSSELVKNHWQEMWDSVQERALFRVKAELIFEALINSLQIEVSEGEVLKKVNSLKNISKEDAKYSLEVEKLLNLIEQQGQVTIINESLINKGQ